MSKVLPGFRPEWLVRRMAACLLRCQLDLRGRAVYTEAASGAYVVTPILAAMAGAEVVTAETRDSRYGSVDAIATWTREVAAAAGVADRIRVVNGKSWEDLERADIVTNSGFVRPLSADLIERLKPTAVIPLMYESWEFRPDDLDLGACRGKGIAVAGTNECHPALDVFSYLGPLTVRLLQDAGWDVSGSRFLLLCDNPFRPYIGEHLVQAGATVEHQEIADDSVSKADYDAVLVAMKPQSQPILDREGMKRIARSRPTPGVVQVWGDIDRTAASEWGIPVWPVVAPPPGHMGILLSEIGPDPIIRLQSGGLKVGEVLSRSRVELAHSAEAAEKEAERSGWGQILHLPATQPN